MAGEERIMTLHPDPAKSGVRINQQKYDMVCAAILETLRQSQPMSLSSLIDQVDQALAGRFNGSVTWYVITVKQDLEARNVIEQVPDVTPQQLRLVGR